MPRKRKDPAPKYTILASELVWVKNGEGVSPPLQLVAEDVTPEQARTIIRHLTAQQAREWALTHDCQAATGKLSRKDHETLLRTVLLTRHMTQREIAKEEHITENGVKQRLRRARKYGLTESRHGYISGVPVHVVCILER
jgi:DNA-directed RNA polymerase specialized sigma24 family protein